MEVHDQLTEGKRKTVRVHIAIIDYFTQILRDLLSSKIAAKDLYKNNVLGKYKTSDKTWEDIFKRDGHLELIKNATDYAEFDISLLYQLLRNFCKWTANEKPSSDWGGKRMPATGEETVGDDIERIRLLRNKFYGHISTFEISDQLYEDCWPIISDVCKRMENRLTGTSYYQNIRNLQKQQLDLDSFQAMKNYIDNNKVDIVKAVTYQQKEVIASLQNVEGELKSIKGHLLMNPQTETGKISSNVKNERPSSASNNVHFVAAAVFVVMIAVFTSAVVQSGNKGETDYASMFIFIVLAALIGVIVLICVPPVYKLGVSKKRNRHNRGILDDSNLADLAKNIGEDYVLFLCDLNLRMSEIEHIQLENPNNIAMQIVKGLALWRDKEQDRHFEDLVKDLMNALESIDGSDLVHEITERNKFQVTLGDCRKEKKDLTIACKISSPSNLSFSVMWEKDGRKIDIDGSREKYRGGNQSEPSLTIQNFEDDCGSYRCSVTSVIGTVDSNILNLSKPIVPVCKIKEDGENQIIVCEASVTQDSPEITSVQWTKNGDVIDTKLASDTYSGGTVGNPSLTIRVTDPSVIGKYRCCVGNDVGKTQSQIFYLDNILAIPKKYQSVLRYIIIQQGYKLNFNRENDMNHEETNLKDIKKLCETGKLKKYIIHTEEYCEFSSTSKRHEVFLSLSKKVGFIDYFLKHAAKENLKEYIRSSGYRVKVNESCYLLESREQTKVWIEKIGLDGILAHCTLEDESIHQEIASQFQVPIEIVKMDKHDLENFKRHLRKGMQKVFHARGMIVGCARAGKTTLMRKLQNLGVDDVDSTRGLEVHKNVFIIEDDSLKVSKESFTSYLAMFPDQFISRKGVEKQPDHKQSSRTVEDGLETNRSSYMEKEMTAERSLKAESKNTDDSPKLIDENKDHNKIKADSENPKQKRTQLAHIAFDGNLKRREERQGTEIDNNTPIGKKADGGVKHNDPSPHSSQISKQKINAKQYHSEHKKPEHNLSLPSIVPTMFKKNVRKTVTMLDFAGQIIYYACHQAHMSPRAFYILVLNSKKDLEAEVDEVECDDKDSIYRKMKHKDFFRYWLKSIQTYSTGSAKFPPLLLVFSNFENKGPMKERECKEKIKKIFSQEIKNDENILTDEIVENKSFFVEKESERDMMDLKDCIKEIIESLPHWGEKHPCVYVVVENIIETMKERKKIIELQALYKIVEQGEHNISKPDLKARLRFFHEIGIILYFDEEKLQDLIVLDVQWFVDAFKNIITTASHAQEDLNGKEIYAKWEKFHDSAVLSNDLLDAIWKNQAGDFVQHKKLILLYMERLGMLAKIKDEEWYVPCVNKKAFKRKDFETFNYSSILCFQFDFLPEVIFYRLVASCFHIQNWRIEKSEEKQCLFQRVSLFQDDTQKRHFILVGLQNNTICIQVLTPKGKEIDKDFTVRVQKNISPVLNRLSKTFHTNLKEILIGSMCKNVLFGEDLNLHFVPHPSSETLERCEKCLLEEWQERKTNEFFSFWEKTESHKSLKDYCEYTSTVNMMLW